MLTVLSIFGTRPEAIKMAPVVKELQRRSGEVRSLVCVTGQHREMLDQVLKLFAIKPDFDLNLMRPNQTLAGLTASLFEGLERVLVETKPDWIVAQGDTTTVMVASLMAHYHQIRFGHVEAGLRTGDKFRPFPEEANRRIADLLADAYFAPTEQSRQALLKEEVDSKNIFVAGNTVVDALMDVASRPFDWQSSRLASLPADKRLVLITAHRRESFGQPFLELCEAIRELASAHPQDQFIYPVHLNPNVRQPVNAILAGLENVSLIEPLDYFEMVHLMKRAVLILTDSGGIQEEAPSLGVPVLVMRDTTERPEGVAAGLVKLVGTKQDRIVQESAAILRHGSFVPAELRGSSPYGDGKAAQRIVSALLTGAMN